MSSDISRQRFEPTKDFAAVLMQQGRVLLDADWNEWVEILDRRQRAETVDTIGRGVVPKETPFGFQIAISGTHLTIGPGRIYVDGILAENHGKPPAQGSPVVEWEWDPILAEMRGTAAIPYDEQPYLPDPLLLPTPPQQAGPHLVYLDIWRREVTWLEDPNLIENAVGVDSTSRLQTIWQVRVLPDVGAETTCESQIEKWQQLIRPSAGRLTTDTFNAPGDPDPCQVPPTGAYKGLENRLYRVEIHAVDVDGNTSFKWARHNRSVATAVRKIAGEDLVVDLIGRDADLRFKIGDWVEITDDARELAGLPGFMRKIKNVTDDTRTITLQEALPAGAFPINPDGSTLSERHTRVRRWDQAGQVRSTAGVVHHDLNAPEADELKKGVIPLPPPGTSLLLEDGIQLSFTLDPKISDGRFRVGDYWVFVARTADAKIEELKAAPPRGIHHHYCRLALVTFPATVDDCRTFWPPEFGGEGCDCSACVTADSHNSGALTIQSAINQVAGKGGGKVCLGPGLYSVIDAIIIGGQSNIKISGHGLPILVPVADFPLQKPILLIGDEAHNTMVEDIAFMGPPIGSNNRSMPGVVISNSAFVRIKRCLFAGSVGGETGGGTLSPAIGVNGAISHAQIYDNFFANVAVGIAPMPPEQEVLFLFYSSIQNNKMDCTGAGVVFAIGDFLDVSFADNVVSGPVGVAFRSSGVGVSIERNSFTLIPPETGTFRLPSEAIVCSTSQSRISNNRIVGTVKLGEVNRGFDGIVLDGRFLDPRLNPLRAIAGVQIVGNQISGLSGSGIVVKGEKDRTTTLFESIISQNQIGLLDGAGIVSEAGKEGENFVGNFAVDLDISGNSIASVGLAGEVGWGIALAPVRNLRVTGNRIVNVAENRVVKSGVGIFLTDVVGLADVVNNEVRRALDLPTPPDASPWSALAIGRVFGNANIRGNLFQSFGASSTVVVFGSLSCLFCENQCFLDNPDNLPASVVTLGFPSEAPTAGAVVVSSNLLKGPGRGFGMFLNPAGQMFTILGNITSGPIRVGANPLGDPWKLLNVTII